MNYEILGTGKAEPSHRLTNAMLEEMVDTSDAWIVERTGIKERRLCQDETMASLAVKAARAALENSATKPEEIEYIIFATVGGDYRTPNMASVLAHELGIQAPGFDVNAACAGFLYGLDLAHGEYAKGFKGKMLVVGMEVMSKYVDYMDRRTCILFGDGGGAVVLGPGQDCLASHRSAQPDLDLLTIGNDPQDFIFMNGQAVYKYAVKTIPQEAEIILDAAGLTVQDIDYFIPHQANSRIIQSSAEKLKIPKEKVVDRIALRGNTSSGTIPMVLDDLNRLGKLKPGMILFLVAFGGGLTSSGALIRWQSSKLKQEI